MDSSPAIPSLLAKANEALRSKRFQEAKTLALQAQSLVPGDVRVQVCLAMIEAQSGETDSAILRLESIQALSPEAFEPQFWLSVLLRQKGDLDRSLFHARRAASIRPSEGHVYSNLALTQLAQLNFAEAKTSLERAIQLSPRVAQNHELLGKTLWMQGKENLALEAYQRAMALAAPSLDALLVMAQIAGSQNRTEDAIELARKVLETDPGAIAARAVLAGALTEAGFATAAQSELKALLDAEPTSSTAHALVGMQRQAIGQMEEAVAAYRKSIELQPEQGLAYCSWARSLKVTDHDRPIVETMKALVGSGRVNPRGQSYLHFGLGKALEDLGEYEAAMTHYDRANEIAYRLKFGDSKFDRERLKAFIDWTISTFSKDLLHRHAHHDRVDPPIFIVGMMRSGTTLVEQILSSHPDAAGAGERSFWIRNASKAMTPGTSHWNTPALRTLATEYLEELHRIFPDALRFIDKMPGNYRVLGAIAAAFPNARIVHTRRNPIDTCLSIYATPNRVANEFANNRENIVYAYREYRRLMEHWQTVLGPERLLTVDYEALVSDPEPTVRHLVQFCGLTWDDRCLRPEENERSVVTPSVWQVRQPVYTTSVERWRKFEPWLGAFADLIES